MLLTTRSSFGIWDMLDVALIALAIASFPGSVNVALQALNAKSKTPMPINPTARLRNVTAFE
jgi:hypothetical protein